MEAVNQKVQTVTIVDLPGKQVSDIEKSLYESDISDSDTCSLIISSPLDSPVSSEKDFSNSDSEVRSQKMRKKDPSVRKLCIASSRMADLSEKQPFQCNECGKTLSSPSSLERHSLVHSGRRPFCCDVCGVTFTTNGNMHRHMRTHSASSSFSEKRRSVSDSECPAPKKREQVRSHSEDAKDLADIRSILKVTGTTPLFMQLVEGSGSNLRQRRIRGEFPCRLCSLVFPNLRALKGHSRTHLQLAPFKCSLCSFSSSEKSTLMRHLRSHNGDRPFECNICHYVFTTKANCERHLRNRHGKLTRDDIRTSMIVPNGTLRHSECTSNTDHSSPVSFRPFRCRLCKQRFSSRNSITRHVLRRHPTLGTHSLIKEMSVLQNDSPTYGDIIIKREAELSTPSESSGIQLEDQDIHDSGYQSQIVYDDTRMQDEPLDLRTTNEIEFPLDLSVKKSEAPWYSPLKIRDPILNSVLPPSDGCSLKSSPFFNPACSAYPPLFASPPCFPQPAASKSDPNLFQSDVVRAQLVALYASKTLFEENQLPNRSPSSGCSQDSSKENSPTVLNQISSTPVDSYKCRPKQRRYRTERPFECSHCTARFTLRSNMDRHVKQQHPQHWRQRPRGGRRNPLIAVTLPNDTSFELAEPEEKKVPLNEENVTESESCLTHVAGATVKEEYSPQSPADHENTMPLQPVESSISQRIAEEEKKTADLASVSRLIDNASCTPDFRRYFSTAEEEDCLDSGHESVSESSLSSELRKRSAYSSAPHRVSCPFCFRQFPWSSSLRRHVLTHTGQKPYKCPQCPLWFTTKSNCERHLVRKHGTAYNVNAINSCHASEQALKCAQYPNSLAASSLSKKNSAMKSSESNCIDEEEEEVTAPDSDCALLCRKCGQCLPSLDALNQHVDIQHGDLPFKCHLCESSHSERGQALEHLRERHSSEYEALISKGALADEEPPPSEPSEPSDTGKLFCYGNRKVTCVFCLRRFWSAEDLRRHMRTHTGERPFSCDICDRRFTLKHSMLRHKKKHISRLSDGEKLSGNEEGSCDEDEEFSNVEQPNVPSDETIKSEPESQNSSNLISNLLGIQDSALIDKVLISKCANDAAKLLGMNGN